MNMLLSSFGSDQHFDSRSDHTCIRAPLKTQTQLDGGNNNDNSDTTSSSSSSTSDTGCAYQNHHHLHPRQQQQLQRNNNNNQHQIQLQIIQHQGSTQAQAQPQQPWQQARPQQQLQTDLPSRHPVAAVAATAAAPAPEATLGIGNLSAGCSSPSGGSGSTSTGGGASASASGANSSHNSAPCNQNQQQEQQPFSVNHFHHYQPAAPAQGLAGPGLARLKSAYQNQQQQRQLAGGVDTSPPRPYNSNQNILPACVIRYTQTSSKRPYLMDATHSPDQLSGGGNGCEAANASRGCVSLPPSQPMLPSINIIAAGRASGGTGTTTNESSRSNSTTSASAGSQYYYEQTTTTTTQTTKGFTFGGNPPPPHPSLHRDRHHHHHHHHPHQQQQRQQHSIVAVDGSPNVNPRSEREMLLGHAKAAGPLFGSGSNKMIKLSHNYTNQHHQANSSCGCSSNHNLQINTSSESSSSSSSTSIGVIGRTTSSIGNIGGASGDGSNTSTGSRQLDNEGEYLHHTHHITNNHRRHHHHHHHHHHQHRNKHCQSSNHTTTNDRRNHQHHHARRHLHNQSSTSATSSKGMPAKSLGTLHPDIPLSLPPPSPPQAMTTVAVSQTISSPSLSSVPQPPREVFEIPTSATVEGHKIVAYSVDGEHLLSLPHFLATITDKFDLTRIVDRVETYGVKFIDSTPAQLAGLIKFGHIHPKADQCSLVRRSDADRLCLDLFEQCYRSRRNNIVEFYRKQQKSHTQDQSIIEQQLFGDYTDDEDQACVTISAGPIPMRTNFKNKGRKRKIQNKTKKGCATTTTTTIITEIESSSDEELLVSHPKRENEGEHKQKKYVKQVKSTATEEVNRLVFATKTSCRDIGISTVDVCDIDVEVDDDDGCHDASGIAVIPDSSLDIIKADKQKENQKQRQQDRGQWRMQHDQKQEQQVRQNRIITEETTSDDMIYRDEPKDHNDRSYHEEEEGGGGTSTSRLVAVAALNAAAAASSSASGELININVAGTKSTSTPTPTLTPTPSLTETRSNANTLDADDEDDDLSSIDGSIGDGCLSAGALKASKSERITSLNETNRIPRLSLSRYQLIGVSDSPKGSSVSEDYNELAITHQSVQLESTEIEVSVESPGSGKADNDDDCQSEDEQVLSDSPTTATQVATTNTTTTAPSRASIPTSPPTTTISATRQANVNINISACRNNENELGDDSRVGKDVFVTVADAVVASRGPIGLARSGDIDTEIMNANAAAMIGEVGDDSYNNAGSTTATNNAISSNRKAFAGTEIQLFNPVAAGPILDLVKAISSTLQIRIYHRCHGKGKGLFYPALLEESISDCIECEFCHIMISPRRFVGHNHGPIETNTIHWGFNSYNWNEYVRVSKYQPTNNLSDAELNHQFDKLLKCAEYLDNGSTEKIDLEDRYVFDPRETNLDLFFAIPEYSHLKSEYLRKLKASDGQQTSSAAAALAALSVTPSRTSYTDQQHQSVVGERIPSGSNMMNLSNIFDTGRRGGSNNTSSDNITNMHSDRTRAFSCNSVSNSTNSNINVDPNQNISHEKALSGVIMQPTDANLKRGGSSGESYVRSPGLQPESQVHHHLSPSPISTSSSVRVASGCHQSMASLAVSSYRPSSSSTTTTTILAPAPSAASATSSSCGDCNLLFQPPPGSKNPMTFLPNGFSDRPSPPRAPSLPPISGGSGASSSDGTRQSGLAGCRPGLPRNRMEPINFASLTPAEQQEILSTFMDTSKSSSSTPLAASTSLFIPTPLKNNSTLVEHQPNASSNHHASQMTTTPPPPLAILPSQQSKDIEDAADKMIGESAEKLNSDVELERESYICTHLASYLHTKGISSTMASDIVGNTLIIIRKSGILF